VVFTGVIYARAAGAGIGLSAHVESGWQKVPGGESAGANGVEVGDKLWVGSFRGNRIAIVPAP
jgi:hypothetical protein